MKAKDKNYPVTIHIGTTIVATGKEDLIKEVKELVLNTFGDLAEVWITGEDGEYIHNEN